MNAAQAAKSAVEDRQRELRQQRAERGEPAPTPRFFVPVGDKFMPKLDVDKLPQNADELESLVRNFIFGDRVPGPPSAGFAPPGSTPALSVEVPPAGSADGPSAAQAAPVQRQMAAQAPAPAQAPVQTQAAAAAAPVAPAAGAAAVALAQNATPAQNAASAPAAPVSAQNAAPAPAAPASAQLAAASGAEGGPYHLADAQHPVPAAPDGVDAAAATTGATPGTAGYGHGLRRTSTASTISDDEFHDAHEDLHPPPHP